MDDAALFAALTEIVDALIAQQAQTARLVFRLAERLEEHCAGGRALPGSSASALADLPTDGTPTAGETSGQGGT
jgi:hypothetical protein